MRAFARLGSPLTTMAVALVLAGCASTARPALVDQATVRTGATFGPIPGVPARLIAEARPIGSGARFRPPVAGAPVGRCQPRLEQRYGVHVEVFAADRVVVVAAGIGTRPPRRRFEGRIVAARCYGALVTVEPTGVVLVRPGRPLHLADLFASWGQTLGVRYLAGFASSRPVAVYVGGVRWRGAPPDVPLSPHAEIVLEVGPPVEPHARYRFPPGL